MNHIVTIDGPAGAGKSSVAKDIARQLKYQYIDTGAMYRAMALQAMRKKIPIQNEKKLLTHLKSTKISFKNKKNINCIFVNGKEETQAIRSPEATHGSSAIAVHKGIRKMLVKKQQDMGRAGGVVMEGRDIGTVVFPQARFKFYLDASPLERARRRYKELKAKNMPANLNKIAASIKERDQRDSARQTSPLRPAADAVIIDTTPLSQKQVCQAILCHIDNVKKLMKKHETTDRHG